MADMQLTNRKQPKLPNDAKLVTQSLLHRNSSVTEECRCNINRIVIGFIFSIVITAFISSLVTYLVVNDNNQNDDAINIIGQYDVAIIGAGSTGLAGAYFLAKQYPDLKIIVLEELSRFGGRQWTSVIHKVDENDNILNSIHFENGAMRFASYNILTLKLLSYLNLCDDIMPISHGVNVSMSSQQIYQYRNHRITGNELFSNHNETINYFSSIFHVNNDEISYLDGNANTIWRKLYDRIILENSILNENEPVTESDWYLFRNNYTFAGEYLYNYGERIALRIIGNYSREINSYLYRSLQEQTNNFHSRNLAMLLWEMFNKLQYTANYTNKTNQWTLKNGYVSMSAALYDWLANNENIDVVFNNKISSIRSHFENKYYKYLIQSNLGQNYYTSNKIILSIPPGKLLKLLPYSPVLDTVKFRNMLDSFVWGDYFKINLIYDSSFWIEENLQALMPSNSDLEIREFFVENAWTNGTLTAIHLYASSHGNNNAFWYGAQLIGDKYPIHDSLKISHEYYNDSISNARASIVVVEEVVKQMQQLTQKVIPMPLAAFINIMGRDMAVSGTTRFKVASNADSIIDGSYNPIPNEDIFMAISDFSSTYGWMESSISAALNNLERNFNVQNPLAQQPICTL